MSFPCSPRGLPLPIGAILAQVDLYASQVCAPMFPFFRRRKEADATARRIIDQGRFLGAGTPREAVEMLWGRPLSENEWVRYARVWERIWRESRVGDAPSSPAASGDFSDSRRTH